MSLTTYKTPPLSLLGIQYLPGIPSLQLHHWSVVTLLQWSLVIGQWSVVSGHLVSGDPTLCSKCLQRPVLLTRITQKKVHFLPSATMFYPPSSILPPLPTALYPPPSVLHPLPFLLYPPSSTLRPLPFALCPPPPALQPIPSTYTRHPARSHRSLFFLEPTPIKTSQ